jgi:hypothetical protein
MKKKLLILFIGFFLCGSHFFINRCHADCFEEAMGPEPDWSAPEDSGGGGGGGGGGGWGEDTAPVDTTNYSAEAWSDVGTAVSAMKQDAIDNGQTLETNTGYYAYTQNGYVYREDPDGRGFTQLGQNYQTGALINGDGQTVDYNKAYSDWGATNSGGSGGVGGGGSSYYGGDTGTGVDINTDNAVKLPSGGYGFSGDDGNLYQVQNGQWVQAGSASGAAVSSDSSGERTLIGNDQYGLPVYKDTSGNYYELGVNGFTNASGSDIAITPLSESGSSGTRDLVGTTDSGNSVFKDGGGNYYELRSDGMYPLNGTTGNNINLLANSEQTASSSSTGKISVPQSDGSLKTAEKGSDGTWNYINSDGSTAGTVNWSNVSNSSYSSAGLTTPSGQQLIKSSSGQLLQMSGGQMIPYTGSTIMSGSYGGASTGLFGALGSAVGSVVGGVGSTVGGWLGGGAATGGNMGYPGGAITGGSYGSTVGGGYYSTGGGYTTSPLASSSAGGWNPANYASTGLPTSSIYSIVRNLVMWALSIFGFIGIIGFVISGVWYLLAAGDDTLMKRAKNGMLYSIIGVVVGLIGLVIIYAVNALLSGSWFF